MPDSLFTPFTLRDTEFRNRVMLSPMCQYSADDGFANDWHRVHLGSRAAGGAGVVMTEATAVEPRGRITPDCLGIWSDEHAEAIEPIVEFVKSQGATPGIQLAHAGRKASHQPPAEGGDPIPADRERGWETVSATDAPYPDPDPNSDADDGELASTRRLDGEGIDDVIDAFTAAAERSRDVGFEVAEVHAAHGYLLHQFLSPVTNDRDDAYGGSFENRTRLLREVVEAVREVWPDDQPVFVRISATDWLPDRDSWDVDDSVRLAPLLAEAGADLIDVSGGGIHPDQQLPGAGPGYQVPYAEAIREGTDVPVAAVGGITEPTHADALVRNERADLVALGREMLRHPYWPLEAAHELGADVAWPVQYRRGQFD
ncbi:NADH:flavin oxidoreductase/NADH oxidase [Halorubrum lacusprofundi]|jgi:2,4-dienoyl-CoA reductase-like NADH-dependent reductase (Old Yellow Enzyme family)|uniref:NADH:flavin oxidoreductase/NADH oxidase n=1 Tax=Halorubrum lacusprofundi (strain ATCC 49239 / DSM 5036 / JCM 8891 / ACAM 34) TaxID=416348 RepID=B9LR36_HALLT|nr:NADH:flavin oxidoreductase/NADH oxidase [Halorubrum lacusprofundi]ACM57690.1 NADH:flavin oxidoreductase/NADH oxidase [Halorubrum lacusprofundi ATCC 49239]MCG1005714.1 NADH:flavin oxidoreductase/NADH oxidase [Halorubrum lacusprofundi]